MSPLDARRFAFVLAHLEHFSKVAPARVLAALGHSPSDLAEAAICVPMEIAEAARIGDLEPAEQFGRHREATLAELKARNPSLEEVDARLDPIAEDETVAAADDARGPVLPFRAAAAGQRTAFSTPLRSAPAEQSGATLSVGTGFVAAPSTPFEAAKLSRWTVERYAAFIADKRSAPPSALLERYGEMADQDEVALMVHFNKRFRDQPGLRERWEALVSERMRANARTRWTS
jgi:hypothetical protein